MYSMYIMKCGHISDGIMSDGEVEIPVCVKCRLLPHKMIGKEYDYRTILKEIKVSNETQECLKQRGDSEGLFSVNFVADLLGLSRESVRRYPERYEIGKRLSGWYFTMAEILIIYSRMAKETKKNINFSKLNEIQGNLINSVEEN